MHLWAYLIFSNPETVTRVLCYSKVMTEQLDLEERLQQAEKMASLGQLAASTTGESREYREYAEKVV